MSRVICTAGHIDHGKTALVLALTGHDTDRLPQEKARGITIELGFAPLTLPSGLVVSIVDVPGHERFVRHMVAGASGVDAALVCVAADDGVMPQTREHLAVLRLLGITRIAVAVTRSDLADPGPATAGVRQLLGGDVPVVPVSAVTGDGIAQLVACLEWLVAGTTRRHPEGGTRLYVDRAFTAGGTGTVVTGTLWGAPIKVGDRMRLLPGGARGRVRSLQVHDAPGDRVEAGRVAVALAGVRRDQASRGDCLVAEEADWTPTRLLDVRLRWLPDADATLRTGRQLQAFLGTGESAARCVLLERPQIAAGEDGYVQLRLERPLVAAPGDLLVLRSAERRTVAGAVVVDARPSRHGRSLTVCAALAAMERDEEPAAPASNSRPATPPAPTPEAATLTAVRAALADAGLDGLTEQGATEHLNREAGDVRDALYRASDVRDALYHLRRMGAASLAEGLWFDADAVHAAGRAIPTHELLTIGELRDLWGVGRRRAVAIAQVLDQAGMTVRRGEHRMLSGGRS